MLFTFFGFWLCVWGGGGEGGVSKSLVHNLLMQFVTLDNSKIETLETYLFSGGEGLSAVSTDIVFSAVRCSAKKTAALYLDQDVHTLSIYCTFSSTPRGASDTTHEYLVSMSVRACPS